MKYLILLMLLSVNCYANETFVKYGIGIGKSANDSYTEVKTVSIGRQTPYLNNWMIYQYELGAFTDFRSDQGRKGSFFGTLTTGVNVENSLFYAQGLFGLAVITNPDSYLGFPLQFTEEVNFGLMGNKGTKLGVSYKHMSSGGIFEPNIGRDLFSVRISIPW